MRLFVQGLALLVGLTLWAGGSVASAQLNPKQALGIWQRDKPDQKPIGLSINFVEHLSKRQLNLINSGFSTFSSLEIYKAVDAAEIDEKTQPFIKTNCTVKYDTWQERYELAKIERGESASIVNSFDLYAERCLAVRFSDTKLLEELARTGGNFIARLFLDQISAEKADEIKQWLVRQQSGVMQGLFSHMLGDLTLAEQTEIKVSIPPLIKLSDTRVHP